MDKQTSTWNFKNIIRSEGGKTCDQNIHTICLEMSLLTCAKQSFTTGRQLHQDWSLSNLSRVRQDVARHNSSQISVINSQTWQAHKPRTKTQILEGPHCHIIELDSHGFLSTPEAAPSHNEDNKHKDDEANARIKSERVS